MNSVAYIWLDVHKESHTICSYRIEDDEVKFVQKIKSDYKMVLKYIEQLRRHYGEGTEFMCGYEAGPMGYRLYHELNNCGIACVIMAPHTLGVTNNNGVKTNKNDAKNIARSLAFRLYSEVHVPTAEDEEVKEYIRMRDDMKEVLKKTKQRMLAFVLRHGYKYDDGKSYWTIAHIKWLRSLEFEGLLQEVMTEYFIMYDSQTSKLERLDERIEELASGERYAENVKRLQCLLGVKTYTALSVIVETGDFRRFSSPDQYSAFLGLVPSEDSSGEKQKRGGITKAGNRQVRKLLIEASQSYSRGRVGHKSKELNRRQRGNPPEVIAYADKANERLRRRFYHLLLNNNKARNKAVTAVARELACFMWGLMTDNIV